MTTPDDDLDDDRFAGLLAQGGDGAPPDRAFLDGLRMRSTDAFVQAAPLPRKPAMKTLLKFAGAAIAAAVLIAVVPPFWRTEPNLKMVLDRVANTGSLHLQILRDGRTLQVWVAEDMVRLQESPERYTIVQGETTYRIDEAANRVTAGTGDYLQPGLNLFALLGLIAPDSQILQETTPAESFDRKSLINTYRLDVMHRDGAPRVLEIKAEGAAGNFQSARVLTLAGVEEANLQVIFHQPPAGKDAFVVKPTLSEDGRAGKMADVQGLVTRKPVLAKRWLPVRPNGLLMPGDWIRCEARGANAAALKLLPSAEVIVGPGALLEVIKPNQVRLHEGEAEIAPAKGTPIELLGPGNSRIVVSERGFYRIIKEQMAKAPEPLWLKGFKGSTANESLGSLVAQVEGRNVPLTVGYHKVSVDIRDQIARTTIEESFVNHTNSQLEGVFYFPLPQDASISGFAMWIGDQLVEADVVEKQRAREIYEEILREKRDPGLLEWTGGNIFKARVWPIFAHSEKRIRITYTQVLPLKGNSYRYSYALQSEMLKLHPLRELSLDVKVSSAVPLKAVTCPTHATRLTKTEKAAQVEFAAQAYTPTRDFEVVMEVADKAPAVTVVPHRRGSDGYFLVQLTTPATEQVANDAPLNLLVLCDTSASIDAGQRAAQLTLAGAMLEALTPNDTFNLAACDVSAVWAFDAPQPATAANLAKARAILHDRLSLGWSDLDAAFASAIKQCGPSTQVVYLGDGIANAKDANPQAFAERLKANYKASGATATFHAVALGSSFEPSVMKAIASLGSGSLRRVSGEQGPVAIALELLDEMLRPPLRNLKVTFNGWETARVYPEVLGNLVPGTQQILIGRYKPEGQAQFGEVVLTGTQNGKPIRTTAAATLPDGEAGNSFLPRLWARMHLDKLLEQPQTATVKDDVIALSEEFGIITPYTSFLVLESDADRDRFKVTRRFAMRDGEQYFAKGRNDAEYDLARQQMKLAGTWRLGLRREVLQQLGTLGRDLQALDYPNRDELFRGTTGALVAGSSGSGGKDYSFLERATSAPFDGLHFGLTQRIKRLEFESVDQPSTPLNDASPLGDDFDEKNEKSDLSKDLYFLDVDGGTSWEGKPRTRRSIRALQTSDDRMLVYNPRSSVKLSSERGAVAGRFRRGEEAPPRWFDSLFPNLAEPAKPAVVKPSDWPAEARDLARLLIRREELAKLSGLRIERQMDSFDVRDGAITAREARLELYSPTAWAMQAGYDGVATTIDWCDAKERGIYSNAFQLGRVRSAVPRDLSNPPLATLESLITPLDETHRTLKATVETVAGKTVLVLRQESSKYEGRFTIDAAKRVLLHVEHRTDCKKSSTTIYNDIVEVGGLWWAKTAETLDAKGRRTVRTTWTVTALSADEFAAQMKATLAGRAAVQLLRSPAKTLAEARKAVAAGTATFDDRFTLLNSEAATQQWAKAAEQLEALEKLTTDKPGVRWLRTVFLQASRRGEELRQRLLAEAETLLKLTANGDRVTLADSTFHQGQQVLAANELLVLLDKLRPAYDGQPPYTYSVKHWKTLRVNVLANRGDRGDELIALQKELAAEYPRDSSLQSQYAQALYNRGDREAAFAHLAKVLTGPWQPWEENELRRQPADWLEAEGRFAELIAYLAAWLERSPETESPYARYLSALVRSGQDVKAGGLIVQWLKEAQIDGEITTAARMRLQAAAHLAGGNGHNLSTERILPAWRAALAEAFRYFVNHPRHYRLTDALNTWQTQNLAEIKAIKTEVLQRLVAEVGDLDPPRLAHLLSLALHNASGADDWLKLAVGLKARWRKTAEPAVRHQFGSLLTQILGYVPRAEHLAFLREQFQDGPVEHRVEYAAQLFDALLNNPWTIDLEREAIALLPRLGEDGDARQHTQVLALHRLTDRMVQAREAALRDALANPEKLPRPELSKKHAEFAAAARKAFAERLAAAAWPDGLKPWATAERLFLLARTDAEAAKLAAECWAFLGDAPKPRAEDEEPTPQRYLEELLHERYVAMALYFAAKPNAAPELIARTRKYLAADPHGKSAMFALLVALDRPKDLEAALAEWIKAEDVLGRWRTALGFILAEQGKIKDAIAIFEVLEKSGDLDYAGSRALAGWYMAVNRREPHEAALIGSFRMLDENTLSQLLYRRLQPWQRQGQLPTELDADVLRTFTAIFAKSSYPQNYLDLLRQYYQACRDFRLLAVMCDSVIGQSASKVYPFLQGLQPVLAEVRDEAAADELLARIEALRKTAKTPVDLRALDFLELQVRRRAAELLNQPGPHAELALAAMKRAFARPMAEGEPLLVSSLLRHLGAIARADLAAEQLRELKELHAAAKPGTYEQMEMAHNYAIALGEYGKNADGIAVLRTALDGYATAHDGILPVDANDAVQKLVGLYEHAKQYAEAEALLKTLVGKPANTAQKLWLALRLDEFYHRALGSGSTVSLGQGEALYRALEKRLIQEAGTADPNHRTQLIHLLCAVYRTARNKSHPSVAADLTAFANKVLPTLLTSQSTQYDEIIGEVARTVHDLVGPGAGISFLLERIGEEPAWLRWNDRDGWSRHGSSLAYWHHEAKSLPREVEARLLTLVLQELRLDLSTQRQRNRQLYYVNHSYYWAAKEAEFARVADEVYAEQREVQASVRYIAEYFYSGCNRPIRAIDVLFEAHRAKRLDDDGQLQLVRYLHWQGRYGQSIALLVPMVERSPDSTNYRALLCDAYFHTGKAAELKATFAAAEAHFRHKDRWAEGTMAALADCAVNCELFGRAVVIYGEVIPLHQRSRSDRGIGQGTLSRYYQRLATAHTGLNQPLEALDAAGGAIVSWGPNVSGRGEALNSLHEVLRAAKDLEMIVAHLDAELAKTGLVNPIVRKALGRAFFDRGTFALAITQLQVALSGQPNDAETLTLLIDCFDKTRNPEGAVAQMVMALQLNRRDIARYETLGQRLVGLDRGTEAERAFTSIVEVLPNEAEGHALLAEVRQKQNRWADAIAHWQQVATIRALEPTGLLGLATAQLHEKQWAAAAATIKKLQARTWPPHFDKVPQQILDLEGRLKQSRK